MQIKTEADRIQLAKEIKVELGIDIEKYHSTEVVESLLELLSLPQYIIGYVVKPVLLSLAAFVLGFFLLQLTSLEYLIYALLGFFLFLAVGILLGLLLLSYKIKGNLKEVMQQSVGIFNNAIADLQQSKENLNPERKKYQYHLLFQGIMHFITIPIFTEAFTDKIPLWGKFVRSISYHILNRAANVFDVDQANEQVITEVNQQGEVASMDNKISPLHNLNTLIEQSLDSAFQLAQFPVKLILGISAIILLAFLYFIN